MLSTRWHYSYSTKYYESPSCIQPWTLRQVRAVLFLTSLSILSSWTYKIQRPQKYFLIILSPKGVTVLIWWALFLSTLSSATRHPTKDRRHTESLKEGRETNCHRGKGRRSKGRGEEKWGERKRGEKNSGWGREGERLIAINEKIRYVLF